LLRWVRLRVPHRHPALVHRHALNHYCPSHYFTTDDELFPGGQLIASERFTDDSFWQPVPEHRILILDADKPPELLEL
jgi:glutamine amidotransferase